MNQEQRFRASESFGFYAPPEVSRSKVGLVPVALVASILLLGAALLLHLFGVRLL